MKTNIFIVVEERNDKHEKMQELNISGNFELLIHFLSQVQAAQQSVHRTAVKRALKSVSIVEKVPVAEKSGASRRR